MKSIYRSIKKRTHLKTNKKSRSTNRRTRSIKKRTSPKMKKKSSLKMNKKSRSTKQRTRSIKKRSKSKKRIVQRGSGMDDVNKAKTAFENSKSAYEKKIADNSKAIEGIFDKYIKYLIKTQELQKDFSNEIDGEIPTMKIENFKDYKTVYNKYKTEMTGLINTYIDNEKKYLMKLIEDTDYLKDLYGGKINKTSILGKLTPKQTAAKQEDEKYAREAALAQAKAQA
jgi:hypothetical protein